MGRPYDPDRSTGERSKVTHEPARITHPSQPLELPAQHLYLSFSQPHHMTSDDPNNLLSRGTILTPPIPERVGGFRASDRTYINYLQAREKTLIPDGYLWVEENGQLFRCDFLQWFERTGVVYLPYLLFAEKNLLELHPQTIKTNVDWSHQAAILDQLFVRKISEKIGWGVFARTEIEGIIGEYTGIIHSLSAGNPYTMFYRQQADITLNIDARFMGNITRFINHSQHANIQVDETLTEDGILHLEFRLTQKLKPQQQLLLNYGASYWLYEQPQILQA